MKKFRKIKKYLILIVTIIISLSFNFLGITNSVYAAQLENNVYLQNIGDCGTLLKYNGIPVITTYVAYEDAGTLCPAYCLNSSLPGVGESGSYTVSTSDLVTDVGLWRRVINGYPYKTISELGCQTIEEAFTATKHAIYCYVQGNNPDSYSAIGEAGQRTLNAMMQIISNAQNSTESKMQTSISIEPKSSKWDIDTINKTYLSKTYQVQSNADFSTYTISIENAGSTNLPDGIKITNNNNNEQTTFNKGETFKVLIPLKNLNNKGEFSLNVKSEINTKPVLYGRPPSSDLQDYAVTTLKYEDGTGTIQDSYEKNKTKIIIHKQEKDTEKPLEGVTFNLLDEAKKVIKKDLKTNKDGIIEIEGIIPGKYYIQEIATLDGYLKYDEDIEIDVKLNEEFVVTVKNSKEITVSKEPESATEVQQIKKLPVTGM